MVMVQGNLELDTFLDSIVLATKELGLSFGYLSSGSFDYDDVSKIRFPISLKGNIERTLSGLETSLGMEFALKNKNAFYAHYKGEKVIRSGATRFSVPVELWQQYNGTY